MPNVCSICGKSTLVTSIASNHDFFYALRMEKTVGNRKTKPPSQYENIPEYHSAKINDLISLFQNVQILVFL